MTTVLILIAILLFVIALPVWSALAVLFVIRLVFSLYVLVFFFVSYVMMHAGTYGFELARSILNDVEGWFAVWENWCRQTLPNWLRKGDLS